MYPAGRPGAEARPDDGMVSNLVEHTAIQFIYMNMWLLTNV